MERDEFTAIAESAFDGLPEKFKDAIENVGVIIEDFPDEEIVRTMQLKSKHHLLGLYQGIPLSKRGTWYGMTPVTPDKIFLFQKNIESVCHTKEELIGKIHEVLIHEIGHYFGMNEEEIRSAGY